MTSERIVETEFLVRGGQSEPIEPLTPLGEAWHSDGSCTSLIRDAAGSMYVRTLYGAMPLDNPPWNYTSTEFFSHLEISPAQLLRIIPTPAYSCPPRVLITEPE